MVLVVILLVLIMVVVLKPAFSNSAKQPTQTSRNINTQPSKAQQLQYSTVVNMKIRSQFGPSKLMCKDGVVYVSTEEKIGRYEMKTGNMWVYHEGQLIGSISGESNGISLFNKQSWRVAEVLESHIGTIIDNDSYEPIAKYEGDIMEAGAAFVCWAFNSKGNRYSDYFQK